MKGIPVVRSDGKRYRNMTDAANDIGGQKSHISECTNNKRNTHKGWRWNYDTMGETKN